MDDCDLNMYRKRLYEAAAWCSKSDHLGPIEAPFRTNLLAPNMPFFSSLRRSEPLQEQWTSYIAELDRNRVIVDRVCERRTALIENIDNPSDVPPGRLVLCRPSTTLEDGLSQVESAGFFDKSDLPGWDTWIAYIVNPHEIKTQSQDLDRGGLSPDWLVAWVPARWVDKVNQGILSNITDCISWPSERDYLISSTLRYLSQQAHPRY
jgi:hypothetical protein